MKEKKSKRELILDAAFSLFLEKCYWDTKIIDISEAAGIGKGTIYEYFESKDAILFELFKVKIEEPYQELANCFTPDMNCEQKIREYVKFDLSHTQRFGFSKNILMNLIMKSDVFKNQALVDSIHNLIGFKANILCGIIEEGIQSGEFHQTDPAMATISIMGALNSFISFDCGLVIPNALLPKDKIQTWKEDDFLELIFSGLINRK